MKKCIIDFIIEQKGNNDNHGGNSSTSPLLAEVPLKAATYQSGQSLEVTLLLVKAEDGISLLSKSETKPTVIPPQ